MLETDTGIILKSMPFKERDQILTVLSPVYGKYGLLAAGTAKLTSRNASSVLPLTKGEFSFDLKDGKTLFKLRQARTLVLYRNMHEDLPLSCTGEMMAGLMEYMVPVEMESEGALEQYALLHDALTLLNNMKTEEQILTLSAVYMAELLKLFGMGLETECCAVCGKTVVSAFSVEQGGFVCEEHLGTLKKMDTVQLKRMRWINHAGLAHITEISAEKEDVKCLEEVLVRHAGVNRRIFSLYNRINRID